MHEAMATTLDAVAYLRTSHDNIHGRGQQEESTITKPFDRTMLNELDRFHLVIDTMDRLPPMGDKGIPVTKLLWEKLIEHKQGINTHGHGIPEIRASKWEPLNE